MADRRRAHTMMTSTNANHPNVLIFCVDEMRADHLRCAGNAIVQTPTRPGGAR